MLKLYGNEVELKHFPDGTLLIKEDVTGIEKATITWLFESNEELVALSFLNSHLRCKGVKEVELKMPYIPNARQDRVKKDEDVFTLKYFAQIINSMGFSKVTVLDPHSYVSEALIDNICICTPQKYVEKAKKIINEDVLMFYPDEGAMKRYSAMFEGAYVFGIKKRDWESGQIKGLELSGQTELVKGSTVLIIDDICSRGGTFYHSAKALIEAGAKKVYLYISHCENTILQGEILDGSMIEKVFTTNSIFTGEDERIEVFDYE